MAKQHRMALLTAVFTLLFVHYQFEFLPDVFDYSMDLALLFMLVFSVFTTWRRLTGIYEFKALTFQNEQSPQILEEEQ